jgi:hypothetical protein
VCSRISRNSDELKLISLIRLMISCARPSMEIVRESLFAAVPGSCVASSPLIELARQPKRSRGDASQKSMPPIPPPMPPPGPPGIAGLCFFGSSATIASVVIRRPAMEAASCSAIRTTLVGSMMPFDTRLPYSPVCAS